jgi:hypothetical protein
MHRAHERAAVLEERAVRFARKREARVVEVGQHVLEILPQPRGQEKPIVQDLPPAHERRAVGRPRESGDERAHEAHLRHCEPGVWRHLEGAELDEPLAPVRAGRIEELVDADLRTVRAARHVDEQVPEERVAEPRGWGLHFMPRGVRARERNLELVERIVACLVEARCLRRRPHEEAGKEIRQRRMVLREREQTREEVGPFDEGAGQGCRTADRDVVAASAA